MSLAKERNVSGSVLAGAKVGPTTRTVRRTQAAGINVDDHDCRPLARRLHQAKTAGGNYAEWLSENRNSGRAICRSIAPHS
jgi:hypothetical protein